MKKYCLLMLILSASPLISMEPDELAIKKREAFNCRKEIYPSVAQADTNDDNALIAYDYFLKLYHNDESKFPFKSSYFYLYDWGSSDPESAVIIRRAYSTVISKAFSLRSSTLSAGQIGDECQQAQSTILTDQKEMSAILLGNQEKILSVEDIKTKIADLTNKIKSKKFVAINWDE